MLLRKISRLKRSLPKNSKRGFTLIEVVVAISLLSGLIAMGSLVWSYNLRKLKKSEKIQEITMLLETKMHEIETTYKNENINELPAEDEGEFPDKPGYSWKFKTQSLPLPSGSIFLKAQQLPATAVNIEMSEVIKTILAEVIVELQLTVTYSEKNKSMEYSLSAYFVNYVNAPLVVFSQISKLMPSLPQNPLGGVSNN